MGGGEVTEQGVFACECVLDGSRGVLLVSHEDNGDWQFLCGQAHEVGAIPRFVGVNHLLEHDPSLAGLMDLPEGWEAERGAAGRPWLRTRIKGDG
mgnify:CR=1 FL=1